MTDCRDIQVLLAADAFGALDPDDRLRVARHVPGCSVCQEAAETFNRIPGLLDQAGTVHAEMPSAPPLLEASVMASLPRADHVCTRSRLSQRSRWPRTAPSRRRAGAAAFALAAFVAALVVVLAGSLGRSALTVRLAASAIEPDARAVALLDRRPWGTQVTLAAEHLTPTRGAQVYEVWFVSVHGRESAGTFRVPGPGRVSVVLAVAGGGRYRTLGVTLEPDGLHPGRHGPNVLRARLPS